MDEPDYILELQLCGCAESDSVADLLAKLLDNFQDKDSWQLRIIDFKTHPAAYYLATDKLDSLGFIEHGTAIRFPWLTKKGEAWLASYKAAKK